MHSTDTTHTPAQIALIATFAIKGWMGDHSDNHELAMALIIEELYA